MNQTSIRSRIEGLETGIDPTLSLGGKLWEKENKEGKKSHLRQENKTPYVQAHTRVEESNGVVSLYIIIQPGSILRKKEGFTRIMTTSVGQI